MSTSYSVTSCFSSITLLDVAGELVGLHSPYQPNLQQNCMLWDFEVDHGWHSNSHEREG